MPSLLIAAIDIGTTLSGSAFSFLHEYKKNPLQISATAWTSENMITYKTSTCVLFDPTGNFHLFGYEAECKYAALALEKKHTDWYYFRRFKMMLYNKMVCKNISLLYLT